MAVESVNALICMCTIYYSVLCGFILDVTDSTTYATAVEEVTALCGDIGLNLLLHNAGIHIVNSFTNVSEDAMMQVYKTNTVAPLILSKVLNSA